MGAKAFAELKHALTTTPVLATPEFAYPFDLYTDASQFAIGATLLQDQGDGLQPIAYESRKLNSAERNYPIHKLELLAVVHAFRTWRCYLEGSSASTPTISTSSTSPLSETCPGGKLVGWRPSNTLTWTSTTRQAVTIWQTPSHAAQIYMPSLAPSNTTSWSASSQPTKATPT